MTRRSEKCGLDDPLTTAEIQDIAERKMIPSAWDYFARAADEERALERNSSAFNRVNTDATLLGHTYSMPAGVAPTARQKLAGGNGEIDTSRVTAKMNLNMTLSAGSSTPMEDVADAREKSERSPPLWVQVYLQTDVSKSVQWIKRAEAAGCTALVLTVDTPILGNRLSERRSLLAEKELSTKPIASAATVNRILMDARTKQEAKDIADSAGGALINSALSWETTIPFLRSVSSMKILVKGIMSPEDARLAVDYGVDGIVVSNHGGRQLDCVPATLELLPQIAEAVAGKIPVILDGGVRRGSDVFKAIALGADFVLVGRPVLWGLAYDGENGVSAVLNILERELSQTMALAGVSSVSEIGRSYLGVTREDGFGIQRL
ncbi:peroxisomal (S)-2-hydroxy-acid oxidase [Colletotrichum asianum]|uniref:Peroxisomal (S)-2-hydroxy-acid oxidase n=1 Tax=Colletotrichum asianum TaxID=702518 RepID=A0A8H3ZWV1_9PEZI|nr:peroxisomal (S)-2-hydroxy-acid oxidase [Colletotrichum asianum]